jgi:hypothetical protein
MLEGIALRLEGTMPLAFNAHIQTSCVLSSVTLPLLLQFSVCRSSCHMIFSNLIFSNLRNI